jgi:hypothetical protein
MSSESIKEKFVAADKDGDQGLSYQEFEDALGELTTKYLL